MAVKFRVVTLKPQKVARLGRVDAGVDVTEQLGSFRHLQSLVDMGDVILIPDGEEATTTAASSPAPEATVEVIEEAREAEVTEAEAEEVEPAATEGEATGEPETTEDDEEAAPAAEDESTDATGEDAEPPTPTEDVDAQQPGVTEYMDDPTDFTIAEVIAYAVAHPEHVSMLLEAETEGKQRGKLIKALTELSA